MKPLPPETRAAIISELQQGYLYVAIMSRHGVSKNTVSKIAIKAGLRRMNHVRALTSEQEAEIVARYAAGERTGTIAASFDISRDLIWATLQRCGVAARDASECHVIHSLRHDALDVLTPEAAYWCGIFFTDGTVGERKGGSPEVAVVLKHADRGHLVKLRDFLGSTHAITPVAPNVSVYRGQVIRGGPAERYAVRSKHLAARLLELGRYGPRADPELTRSRDFWRGVVDGDGTVAVSCDIPQLKLFGSHWLLSAFVEFLGPVSSRRPLNVRPTKTSFVVSTSYKTAEKVVDRLYAGATVALDRKAADAALILAERDKRQACAMLGR